MSSVKNVLLANPLAAPRHGVVGVIESLLNQMESIKSLMAFWSDGTTVETQLTDLTGNNRHATIGTNLMTDGGAELGSVLTNWNTSTITNSTEQAHSGTKSFKCVISSASTVQGALSPTVRIKAGETVTWSVWFYNTLDSGIRFQVLKGDGTVGYQNLSQSLTKNTWVNLTGSFTDAAGGELCRIRWYIQSGDMNLYADDLSITVGTSNIGVTMANDDTLKAIDTNYSFYTSAGIPKTVRSDIGHPAAQNLKMFCGGEKKWIFTSDIPDVNQRYILYKNFVDHDWPFTSCEIVKTVGSGKDYATIQAAIDSCTAGSLTNRYRIDIYDSFAVTEYAEYTKQYPTGYYNIFAVDRHYVFLNGIGNITIEGTLPEDATDDQIAHAQIFDFAKIGGVRNLTFKKTNGRYTMHSDIAGTIWTKAVNCKFYNYDMDEIIAYRIAHSQTLPTITQGGKTPIGMGHANGTVMEFINCEASGIVPLTCHGGFASGETSYLLLYNFIMTSQPYYSPWCNPDSEILNSMELTTSPGGTSVDSTAQIIKCTLTEPATISDNWTVTTK
jgi:hypothetical protein